MKRLFIIIVLWLLFPFFSYGAIGAEFKNYIHRMWTSDHGLPQNSVYTITQDRKGFLWFGTAEGLVRFDGIKFDLFDKYNVPELKSNVVLAVYEDRKGCLWAGFRNGGVVRKCGDEFTSFGAEKQEAPISVTSIVELDDEVFFGTHTNRIKVFSDGEFKPYKKNHFLPETFIFDMVLSEDKMLYIATDDGIYVIKEDTVSRFGKNEGLPELSVRSLFIDSSQRLWAGFAESGLALMENGKFKVFRKEDGLPSEKLFAFSEDNYGRVWIGTVGGGIAMYDGESFVSFDKKDGLSSDIVRAIFMDSENNMWVGTHGGGLDQFRRGMFSSITVRDGLSGNVIFGLSEDLDGNIYAGTYGKGINKIYRDGTVKKYDINDGLSGNIIAGVHVDRNGKVWVGTYGAGLNIIDKSGNISSYGPDQGLDMSSVTVIFEDYDGTIYIGGFDQALAVYKDGEFKTFSKEGILKNRVVSDIEKDKDGSLLLATEGSGIVRLKNNEFSAITVEDGLSDNKITSIYRDEDNILWATSYNSGLNIIRNGNISSVRRKDGLFDDTIYVIVEDNDGVMWMSSNRGLFTVPKKDLIDFADGKTDSVKTTVYSWKDGMPSNECNGGFQKAGLKTRDGKIMFPTIKGIAVMDPSSRKEDVPIPKPVVTAVYIDGERYDIREKYYLLPKTSKINIQYTAPSFVVPEKIRFRYKLEGFDKDWVEAKQRREAEIMNLEPGTYRFMISVSNSEGKWSETPLQITFVQEPAFHQTALFRIILFLAVFAGIYFPLSRKIRKMKDHNEELSDMINETQEELKQVTEELSSKYASSSLGEEDLDYYKEVIEKFMVEEKPYLDDELTIRKLAKQLEMQPHHLSQVINSTFNMNFYTFVNSYRVDEVIKLMKDPERKHHTILAIAYDSGFKSKSSFNTIFKKMIGKTPSEYRDELEDV